MKPPVAVELWGRTIGAVHQPEDASYATFQYDPDFARSRIEVAPIEMRLATHTFAFPDLPVRTFHGLPGLLSDSLPDNFGNALIDAWLARNGRLPESFSALERLCYVGTRGMGALQFEPATGPRAIESNTLDVAAMVDLASRILSERSALAVELVEGHEEDAMAELLRVGTSAGGARAKALIAWNPTTNEIRSGQVGHGEGFEDWILKFDGVSQEDSPLGDPLGFGAAEYGYYLMAQRAGITMSESRLLEESGRRHFMTRRFDRTPEGRRLHMLSLCGMAHFDFNAAGAYGYEQAIQVIRRIGLSMDAVEEQFRRMVFNIMSRNQDDHVKNIAFLMDREGRWSLSPAFDLTYSYNPSGVWTAKHQMTVNGKVDDFTVADLHSVAATASMKRGRAESIYEEVRAAVHAWPDFAERAGVEERRALHIDRTQRKELPLE